MRSGLLLRRGCVMTIAEKKSGLKKMAAPLHSIEHTEKAWDFFRKMGAPKLWVAPMVDQSELPFRMLCRKHGATGAYTPMIHARLFAECKRYRDEYFSTCPEDRPLLAQFCANDADYLVSAAKLLEGQCDAIDLNLGCPQRIAKKGFYGAFLMDDLELVERLVATLAKEISIPVTCKIRIFPSLDKTLEYAKMLERAQCSIIAVHGRTRDQKDSTETRANWDFIKAVKESVSIPVIANGNIRNLNDCMECMEYTGADGVMSAVSLLEDPALFSEKRLEKNGEKTHLDGPKLFREYLREVERYPVHPGMVKGHAFKLLGSWLTEFTDLRNQMGRERGNLNMEKFYNWVNEIERRIEETGRNHPIPKITTQEEKCFERRERKNLAKEEQQREEEALAGLNALVAVD